jgi:tetratricopeptide (TPR) repeat protein
MSTHEESVFAEALEIADPPARAAFLDRACAGDPGLRHSVESLLSAYDAGEFLEAPALDPVVRAEEPAVREGPGTVVGRYKLLEQIGEGGFGIVFMAEQQRPVRRKVAVKVLKPGMDSRQVIARFEAERQALALMDHLNIARILDTGETAAGRPYFVMELVKGVHITDYCDQNHLSVRERLGLFVSVCQGVQHAHQKGIIHRDLKPSNVLVTLHDGVPVVKVIDFGIAKALGQQLTDKTLFTQFAQLIGTPLYMSPEQAEMCGLDIDTRTDIYSLGVLLYELLTGTTPFTKEAFGTAAYDEMRRIIREEEPARPSTRISTLGQAAATVSANRQSDPKRLSQLVRGDLDWIVMKALEKDRNRRYETASAFAADVQRFLNEEPIHACPPSAAYRLRKFVRRNKGPVLAACLIVLALVLGILGTTLALMEARSQRAAAEANADRAGKAQERAEQGFAKAKEAVEHYLQAVTNDADLTHQRDSHGLRKKLLDAAVPFYQWFTEQKPGDAASEAERGWAYFRLAFVRSEMGEKEAAVRDYECAQTIFLKLMEDCPTVPQYREDLAKADNNLGNLLKVLGQGPAGDQAHRRALEIREKLVADFPTVPAYRRALAVTLYNRGNSLYDLGQRPAAEQAYRRALDIQEKLVADFPTMPEYRLEMASGYNNLGTLLKDLGQRPAAEEAYRRALEIREKLVADFPTVPEYRQALARGLRSQGALLSEVGLRPAAEQALRRAADIQKQLAADFPTMPECRQELAWHYEDLGRLLHDMGQRPAAEQAYRRALEIREKLVADFPMVPAYRQELALIHSNLGFLLQGFGQRPAAEQAYRQALEIQEKLVADFPTAPLYREELALSHNNLGFLLQESGRRPAAEQAYRRALEIGEKLAADFPTVSRYRPGLAGNCVNLGILIRDQGQTEASLAWFARAVALLDPLVQQEPRLATERLFLGNAHYGRAQALDRLGRHPEAVKDWDRALELNDTLAKEPSVRRGRAQSLARAGEHARAVAEVNALAEVKGVDGSTLYDLACVCALAADKVTGDTGPRLAEEYAARAVELLRHAVAKGYKNAAHVSEDKALDALRGRDDFKNLLAELKAKQKDSRLKNQQLEKKP